MTFKTSPGKSADIGLRAIDQLSADVYGSPGSILREVIKNAHDSYLSIEPKQLKEEKLERAIVISRERHANGAGRLFIEDNGIGQSFKSLCSATHAGNSRKPHVLKDPACFRGLLSWALSAGSKIVIESTTEGIAGRSRLQMNVRRICEKLHINTTLTDLLNDSCCISFSTCIPFSTEDWAKNDHGTIVEIECDGKTEIVNGHTLNRVYDLTDPKGETLEQILVERCPIPYAREGRFGKRINEVYDRARYIPAAIFVDGKNLERQLPPRLSAFHTQNIKVAGKVAAIAWYVEDPKRAGGFDVDAAKDLVASPGIQLVKYNVPIGPKNIFCDKTRENCLKWFVGEVHIVSHDLQPDASGQELRIGPARDAFIRGILEFYSSLNDRASRKSLRLSLKKI
jgi:hypothetical protein